MRFEDVNTCVGCVESCPDGTRCDPARQKLRAYSGMRFTSDGFDCALPVAIDSHSHCAYGCLYCFSDNLISHREQMSKSLGQVPLSSIEKVFSGGGGKDAELFRKALRYDRRNEHGYPCPVQLGALNDPCDHIERQQGWLLDFIKIAIKYRQPVRMSTKGTIFQIPEYLDAIAEAPELFWVAFSIITPDDEVIEQIDRRAPNATERLKTMKLLSDVGVRTALRFRPIMPGISDATKQYPQAYKTLIEQAAEAGATAISYEAAFVSGMMTKDLRARWNVLSKVAGVPFEKLYRSFGSVQACMRPPYTWTENIMYAIRDEAHKNGMVVGVSDPVWKQLTDTGCCCGILPDDPVFGNWERESATNQLLLAKDTGKILGPQDITPDWAAEYLTQNMVNLGPGPFSAYVRRHETWADRLAGIWNDLQRERGPLQYFQGALLPDHQNGTGDWFYRYEGLKRQYPEHVPYWRV